MADEQLQKMITERTISVRDSDGWRKVKIIKLDNDDFHLFDKFQLGQSVELDGEEYRIFVIQGLLVVELHLMTESEYKRLTIIQNQE